MIDEGRVPAQIIDGRKISQEIRGRLRLQVKDMGRKGVQPGLAVILVGENPGSITYVSAKVKVCEELGIRSETVRFPTTVTFPEILAAIQALNERSDIHGVLVQLPLPAHLEPRRVVETLKPIKDVDGLHPTNIGRLAAGDPLSLAFIITRRLPDNVLNEGNSPGDAHKIQDRLSLSLARTWASFVDGFDAYTACRTAIVRAVTRSIGLREQATWIARHLRAVAEHGLEGWLSAKDHGALLHRVRGFFADLQDERYLRDELPADLVETLLTHKRALAEITTYLNGDNEAELMEQLAAFLKQSLYGITAAEITVEH